MAVRADVELGGTDQKFNLLMGRTIMEAYGVPPRASSRSRCWSGTDGEQKMSKTYGNYIGVNDPPDEMFGKIMSIPDDLMVTYYSLLTGAGQARGGSPRAGTRRRQLPSGGGQARPGRRDW